MVEQRNRQWQQLLELSESMLLHAHESEWETLSSMACIRQAALERFFSEPVADDAADIVADGIHTISRIDNEIATLARDARSGVTLERETLKKRQQASRAYTDPKLQQN